MPTELHYHPGNDPDCKHANATREHLSGHGQSALYHWHCPDCDESEVEGYEDAP